MIRRAGVVWLVFVVCLALLFGALGWMSWQMLELEQAQTIAGQVAAREESVRLALWRMDSALSAIVARENARPYFSYATFYPAERTYARMFAPLAEGEVLMPSPILTESTPFVRLHFQYAPDGALSSPLVPTGEIRDLAEAGVLTTARIESAMAELTGLHLHLKRETLLAALPAIETARAPAVHMLAAGPLPPARNETEAQRAGVGELAQAQALRPAVQNQPAVQGIQGPVPQFDNEQAQEIVQANDLEQRARGQKEFANRFMNSASNLNFAQQARAPYVQQAETSGQRYTGKGSKASQPEMAQTKEPESTGQANPASAALVFPWMEPRAPSAPLATHVQPAPQAPPPRPALSTKPAEPPGALLTRLPVNLSEGTMQPCWSGDLLVLGRRVLIDEQTYVQGCLLDWTGLRRSLLADIADLLPQADLVPARGPALLGQGERRLAARPAVLEPGALPAPGAPEASPVRTILIVAWAAALLAGASVGLLLFGTLLLSERRGAFVSAVTHELRTPLTTFRMYAEMLAAGMVPQEKRRAYLETLCTEANRLGHLVENVLAYARLERGRLQGRVDVLGLAALLERLAERLRGRATQAGLELVLTVTEGARALRVRVDPAAVEQILFNLVDNACKYAAGGEDRRLHIEAMPAAGCGLVCVRDHGPGIDPADRGRIFRPFSKSARDAANSAPGVGLGLALSRRLARALGGDLRLAAAGSDGACFELRLPAESRS